MSAGTNPVCRGIREGNAVCAIHVYGVREHYDKMCTATLADGSVCTAGNVSANYSGGFKDAMFTWIKKQLMPHLVTDEEIVEDEDELDLAVPSLDIGNIYERADRAISTEGKSLLAPGIKDTIDARIHAVNNLLEDIDAQDKSERLKGKQKTQLLYVSSVLNLIVSTLNARLDTELLKKEVNELTHEAEKYGVGASIPLLLKEAPRNLLLTDSKLQEILKIQLPTASESHVYEALTRNQPAEVVQQLKLDTLRTTTLLRSEVVPNVIKATYDELVSIRSNLQSSHLFKDGIEALKRNYSSVACIQTSVKTYEELEKIVHQSEWSDVAGHALLQILDTVLQAPSLEDCRVKHADLLKDLLKLQQLLSEELQVVKKRAEASDEIRSAFRNAQVSLQSIVEDSCVWCLREVFEYLINLCDGVLAANKFDADSQLKSCVSDVLTCVDAVLSNAEAYLREYKPDYLNKKSMQVRRLQVVPLKLKSQAREDILDASNNIEVLRQIQAEIDKETSSMEELAELSKGARNQYSKTHSHWLDQVSRSLQELLKHKSDSSPAAQRLKLREVIRESIAMEQRKLNALKEREQTELLERVNIERSDPVLINSMRAVGIEPSLFDHYHDTRRNMMFNMAKEIMQSSYMRRVSNYNRTPTDLTDSDKTTMLERYASVKYPGSDMTFERLQYAQSKSPDKLKEAAEYISKAYQDIKEFMTAYREIYEISDDGKST